MDKGWAGITGEGGKGAEDAMRGWEQTLNSAGVQRSWVPVFAADDYSPERLAVRYMVGERSTHASLKARSGIVKLIGCAEILG